MYDEKVEGKADQRHEQELKEWFKHHRYLDKDNFVKLGRWKSKRPTKHYQSNRNELIKEITKLSLAAKDEEVQIKLLLVLKGVSWPVASVILHFAFPDKYPIMDFRVIESLGWNKPKSYNFEFWQKYCARIKEIADELVFDIRTVEKALWKYSKDE